MNKTLNTRKLTTLGILTAIVIILQAFIQIRVGIFAISTVLIPIVIGGALYGIAAGAWLGFVFGATVLLSGDAAFFLGITIPGTIITVLSKGILCGMASALVYKMAAERNPVAAALVAGIICPVVNTAVFMICCRLFFGYQSMATVLTVVVGANFFLELAINIVLNPVIILLIRVAKRMH